MSLPSRERGLKFAQVPSAYKILRVAPFAGAWIEITDNRLPSKQTTVAPFAGA